MKMIRRVTSTSSGLPVSSSSSTVDEKLRDKNHSKRPRPSSSIEHDAIDMCTKTILQTTTTTTGSGSVTRWCFFSRPGALALLLVLLLLLLLLFMMFIALVWNPNIPTAAKWLCASTTADSFFRHYVPVDAFPNPLPRPGYVWFRDLELSNYRRLREDGIRALAEFGDELRSLMLLGGREMLLSPNDYLDVERRVLFRERLHAMAPWLKGYTTSNKTSDSWPQSQLPKPIRGGYAILISGGDKHLNYMKTLTYTVRVIHKSNMPIYIAYRDDQDLTPSSREELLTYLEDSIKTSSNNNGEDNIDVGISFLSLSDYFDMDITQLKGWNLKAYGMLLVPETNVVFVDIDVILLRPPMDLFDFQAYREKGALFFHDRLVPEQRWSPRSFVGTLQPHLSTQGKKVLDFSGFYTQQAMEAGVMVLDKEKRALGLWATCLLLGRWDIRRFAQRDLMYGDKEYYWSAFEAIAEPYQFARFYPGVLGGVLTDYRERDIIAAPGQRPDGSAKELALCGRMLHFDDDGVPLWSNGGYLTKEDEQINTNKASSGPLNPLWFVDGGDFYNGEPFPSFDYIRAQAKNPLWTALRDNGPNLQIGENQFWRLHRGMAVKCLYSNARGIQSTPLNIVQSAEKAIEHYMDLK